MPSLGLAAPLAPEDHGPRPRRDAAAERRRHGRSMLVAELAVPVEGIQRTLQRLSLARVAPAPDRPGPATAHLVRRARHLATELREVIDELLDAAGGDTRLPQRCLPVLGTVEDAVRECRPRLGGRAVRVDVDPRLAVTTHPGRFHEILTTLLVEAARHPGGPDLVVRARRLPDELRLVVDGSHPPAGRTPGVERLGGLVDSLGGVVETAAGPHGHAWSVRLPQQRADDGHAERPG